MAKEVKGYNLTEETAFVPQVGADKWNITELALSRISKTEISPTKKSAKFTLETTAENGFIKRTSIPLSVLAVNQAEHKHDWLISVKTGEPTLDLGEEIRVNSPERVGMKEGKVITM